jgi:hypothetical protein
MASATKLSEGVTRDARYHQAFIDGAATHRLQGQRGTAPLMEIGVYTGRMGFHESSELQGCLTEAELPDPRGAWVAEACALVQGLPPTRFDGLAPGEQELLVEACAPGMSRLGRSS